MQNGMHVLLRSIADPQALMRKMVRSAHREDAGAAEGSGEGAGEGIV